MSREARDPNMEHMAFLEAVAEVDIKELHRKEKTYRSSWKRRGGNGTFHVFARCWDRLEGALEARGDYDVFTAIAEAPGGADGTPLASLRDLRRYLMLVEAEMHARRKIPLPATTGKPLNPAASDNETRQRLHDLGVALESEQAIRGELEARCAEYASLVLAVLPVLQSQLRQMETTGSQATREEVEALRATILRAEGLVIPKSTRGL